MPNDAESETKRHGSSGLGPDQFLGLFRLYEEAAERTKERAWSQTTWILALNAGIIAFSVDFYANEPTLPGFEIIEVIAAFVGVVLCGFLIYLLDELGHHISHHWTSANRVAVRSPFLVSFISIDDASKAREPGYHAKFPSFCRRLQFLAVLFAAVHAGWLIVVLGVLAA